MPKKPLKPSKFAENPSETAKPGVNADIPLLHASAQTPADLGGRIYVVRGMQVMLDEDLAELYGVEAKRINEQVKRNSERFPPGFCFQTTPEEAEILRSQFATLRGTARPPILRSQSVTLRLGEHGKHRKYLPHAFTEQGIAMLSAVLRSETAVRVSIRIMQAFVEMRRALHAHAGLFQRLDGLEKRQIGFEAETDRRFDQVFDALEEPNALPRQGIFYDGQIHDAHTFVSDLIRSAKESIVLIDNYVDDTVLTILGKRAPEVAATLYTRSVTPALALDLERHNAQYPPVELRLFSRAHDRFLILDDTDIYHIGASLKDLGKKWFAFSKFDKGAVEMLERLR